MAKKKQPHQERSKNDDDKKQSNLDSTKMDGSDQPGGDDTFEKLSSLKSLNALLLKETVEKRQEVSSLLESKKSLETELTRSVSQVESLKAELTRMDEVEIDVEVRKVVVAAFVGAQMVCEVESLRGEKVGLERKLESFEKEMDELMEEKVKSEAEIRMLRDESEKLGLRNNYLNKEIDALNEERCTMKEMIVAFQARESSLRDEVRELKGRYEVVVSDSKSKVEEMKVRLGVLEKDCDELKREIGRLKGEKEVILGEKEELVKEKIQYKVKVSELEKEVSGLNAIVLSLREDEEKWRVKFFELEKINDEMSKRIGEWGKELNDLVEEKKVKESEIESLVDEKMNLNGRISELEMDLVGMKQLKEETLEENERLEQVKSRLEVEIVELQNKVNELVGNLASLQDLNREYIEKNEKLVADNDGYKTSAARAVSERDDMKKTLEEEKTNGMRLQGKVSEISKKMEDTAKVIEELRAASDILVKEKKELKNKYTNVVNEKGLSEKKYEGAKMKITELERIMRSKSEAFESVLAMLKDTARQVARNANENEKGGTEGEIEPCMATVERIRLALKSRDDKVGEMEEQLETLKWSLMEARKKKNLWTLVSSCATLFAAIASYAYVAKIR